MRVFLLAVSLVFPCAGFAGTLTPVGPLPYDDTHPMARAGCTHQFQGIVDAGDLDLFSALPSDPQVVICLDSPGGSFMEGIAIGEYLREAGIGTLLEAGATCESACALVFMSGTYVADEIRFKDPQDPDYVEDWQLGPWPWRSMHPTARLGLHAPRLNVPEGQYDEATVTLAYDAALRSLSEFSTRLMQTGPSDPILFNPDLFSILIATPHDQMFYIDTVDLAGRFDIRVGPVIPPTTLSEDSLIQACITYFRWAEDLGNETDADSLPGPEVSGTSVTLMNGLDCNFEKGGQDSVWRMWLHDVPDIAFYPPQMPLTALAP